jgi:hypothetical protein
VQLPEITLAPTPAGPVVKKIQTKDLSLMLKKPVFDLALRVFLAAKAGVKHANFAAQMEAIKQMRKDTPEEG